MKILKKEKSNLIDRTEITAEFPHMGKPTPSNNEIRKAIVSELKAKEELVVIKKIDTKYGEGTSIISAFAYDNLEELKKLEKYEEPKKEEPVKEEAPKVAEEPKTEEKPAEEVKEETPTEPVKEENDKETETEKQANE